MSNHQQMKRLRRKTLAAPVEREAVVQTYRVYVTLPCSHRTSFTVSAKAYQAGKWQTRLISCWQCAEALAREE